MSGGLLQYSGLVTKVKAMHKNLLSREELLRITEFETVEELISFLRENGSYAPTYQSHEEIQHRAQVEAVIDDSLYSDYGKLYRFAGRSQRQGLSILFLRYEINILKTCLEYACQGESEKNLSYLNLFFDRHACFDTGAATRAGSIKELAAALAGTRYEEIMGHIVNDREASYAEYAMRLDIYYYQTVWKQKDGLRDAEMREVISHILGTEIDWQNIMWMYRFKQFYHSRPEDIHTRMIPIRYRLRPGEVKRLLEAESPEAFLAVLGETAYFTEKDSVIRLGDEVTFRNVMDKTYKQVCRKHPMSIAPVFGYLYDKENEIDDLTTILEGIRYRIPAREIQELILPSAG